MIDTIIFDLSEVQMTGLVGVEKRLSAILNLPASEVLHKLSGPDIVLFFNGRITEEEYISRITSKNKWPVESAVIKKLIRENFREIEGMRAIVKRLRDKGYKLGLLSVHGREWVEYISRKFKHHELFHVVSYSFENGISKPNRRAYTDILDKLGSKAENTVFIDDNESNLVPARELGMMVILFADTAKLINELTALGIEGLGQDTK